MWVRQPQLTWPRAATAAILSAAVAVLGQGAASPAGASPAAGTAAPAACQPWAGAPLPGPQVGSGLFGMTVLSACDAWVVGDESVNVAGSLVGVTVTEHWNGATWTV